MKQIYWTTGMQVDWSRRILSPLKICGVDGEEKVEFGDSINYQKGQSAISDRQVPKDGRAQKHKS